MKIYRQSQGIWSKKIVPRTNERVKLNMADSAACMVSWPRLMQCYLSSVEWTKLEAESTFSTKTLQGIESTKENDMTHGIRR